jgi:hypothetical protein
VPIGKQAQIRNVVVCHLSPQCDRTRDEPPPVKAAASQLNL